MPDRKTVVRLPAPGAVPGGWRLPAVLGSQDGYESALEVTSKPHQSTHENTGSQNIAFYINSLQIVSAQ
jgi:hypothetical protein